MILHRDALLPARATLKEWAAEDRPRERLRELGPRALSPRELLALLIETGTPGGDGRQPRTALDLAGDLLRWSGGHTGEASLRRLLTAPLRDLTRVAGIGPAKAAKIQAALELGRRAAQEVRPDRPRVADAADVYERMRLQLRDAPQEEFHVLLLDTQCQVLREARVATGTLDATLVAAREIFRPALLEGAASLILVHNHPSGEPSPSPEDRRLTRQMVAAGQMLGVKVLDHVIIGEGRYFSFVEGGLLEGDSYPCLAVD